MEWRFLYAYRQQWLDGEGVFREVEDKQLLRECKETGKKLLDDLSKDFEKLIHCRMILRVVLTMTIDVVSFLLMK